MLKYSFRILPKSQISNSKLLPKSQTVAEIPNHSVAEIQTLPKSQTFIEIPNNCRNPKPLPNPKMIPTNIPLEASYQSPHFNRGRFRALVLDFGNGFDFGNDLGFLKWFGISAMVWILAMVLDFGNSLGFQQ
uniref:Uncharacterized protein n=1 Tax=Rhizophagus irregularis (strain DAOM 181602 / DAOM 197198 / MUCL 43194) TaxID=747089 RepID=U9SXK5_RHIID